MTSDHKNTIRTEAKRHRDRLDNNPQDTLEACRLFWSVFGDHEPPLKIAAYWPKGREFGTLSLIDEILVRGHLCLLPRMVKGSRLLEFHSWDGQSDLVAGDFGVLQPSPKQNQRPDILIVPLLAFDRRGYRLGYGGGYYDATLADLRMCGNIVAVGWAYAEQAVIFNLPIEEYDQKLDVVITPKRVHSFEK